MAIKAFLSYSTRDKHLAGDLRELLSTAGIDLFLAHHSLAASAEWRQDIKKQIASREIFILLLTKHFHGSKWTDQEVGMAIALEKTILPLRCPTFPYGFVTDYQAIHGRAANLGKSLCELIRGILSRFPKKRRYVRQRIVSALCSSESFHAALSSLSVLQSNFFPLTNKEKAKILEASKTTTRFVGSDRLPGSFQSWKKS